MNREEFPVQIPEGNSIRVDKFVASLGLFSRSQIAKRSVRVLDSDGILLKSSKKVRDGDVLVVEWDDPPSSDIQPEDIDLDILYEDDECVVINKAQGMVVHPAHGHYHGTLVQGLLYRYSDLEAAFNGDRVRPGVVHRLDKDTSGLIIAAKTASALESLAAQFRDRSVKKTYLAIARGVPHPSSGEIDAPIGRDPRDRKKFTVGVRNAKEALSRYEVLAEQGSFSLIKIRILTGRTHQIRVHLKSIGCSILGDPLYGKKDPEYPDATLMLHSWKLALHLPSGKKHRFTAALPDRFVTTANSMGWNIEEITSIGELDPS